MLNRGLRRLIVCLRDALVKSDANSYKVSLDDIREHSRELADGYVS